MVGKRGQTTPSPGIQHLDQVRALQEQVILPIAGQVDDLHALGVGEIAYQTDLPSYFISPRQSGKRHHDRHAHHSQNQDARNNHGYDGTVFHTVTFRFNDL